MFFEDLGIFLEDSGIILEDFGIPKPISGLCWNPCSSHTLTLTFHGFFHYFFLGFFRDFLGFPSAEYGSQRVTPQPLRTEPHLGFLGCSSRFQGVFFGRFGTILEGFGILMEDFGILMEDLRSLWRNLDHFRRTWDRF